LPRISYIPLLALLACVPLSAQNSAPQPPPSNSRELPLSSVYSSTNGPVTVKNAVPPPPSAIDPNGPAVSLETNESLFYLAAALNTCGYDDGLAESAPVRLAVRKDINDELAQNSEARDARDQLCFFIHRRDAGDESANVSQYVSLAVYLTPPPELSPAVADEDLPPSATGVEAVLPYLRKFASAINLHLIWLRHRPEYEQITNTIHDSLTNMVAQTNIYLKEPTSTFEGRRFLILLEPLLSPALTNARVYGSDYIVVTSPTPVQDNPKAPYSVHLTEIRHTYLHFQVEPLIYTRAGALERWVAFLGVIRDAPIDFNFRSNIVDFIAECIIRSVEAHIMDTGIPKPVKPPAGSQRFLIDKYAVDYDNWDHQAEAVRRKTVDDEMHMGFVLTQYFYNEMGRFDHEDVSLSEKIGEMVYGMQFDRELHAAKQIKLYDTGVSDVVHRVPRQYTGLDLADLDMFKGKTEDASTIAQKILDTHPSPEDAAHANFILGRVDLMQRQPDDAVAAFQQTIALSHDPRTLAWSHIYLGRMYDLKSAGFVSDADADKSDKPDTSPATLQAFRDQAIKQYREALTVRDSLPDTKNAADAGIKQPFAPPASAQHAKPQATPDDDDKPVTDEEIQRLTKAAKDSYDANQK
jgi:hypothetical protein